MMDEMKPIKDERTAKQRKEESIQHNRDVIAHLASNPAPLHDLYSMLTKDAITTEMKMDIADIYGIDVRDIKKAFDSYHKQQRTYEAIGGVPKDEYEYVELALSKWGTTMTNRQMFTIDRLPTSDGKQLTKSEWESLDEAFRVFLRTSDPNTFTLEGIYYELLKLRSANGINYSDVKIEQGLKAWVTKQSNEILSAKMYELSYREDRDSEGMWDALIGSITRHKHDECKAVMKHFMWQVKRKMWNRHTAYEMMPVLSGPQQSGKSTLVQRIIAPVLDHSSYTNFNEIADNRNIALWNNFILVLDEMGGSTQANLEFIKQKITGHSWSARMMRTNLDTTVVNKSTLIGTTNKQLASLMFDDTGMRRFYEIECYPYDRDVINNIDYMMLWRSIDENSDTELDMRMIKDTQEEYRLITTFESFIREREFPNSGYEEISASNLYDEYRNYEVRVDPKGATTQTRFGRLMKNLCTVVSWIEVKKVRRASGLFYALTIDMANRE